MKRLFLTLFAVLVGFSIAAPEAEAKRLGGGSSFGMQRQMTPPAQAPRQATTPQPTQQPGMAPAQTPRRSWMGPVAGLAAGLGLAALASHLGLGEEMASFMLMALLAGGAFLVIRLLMRRAAPPAGSEQALQYAGAGAPAGTHAAAAAPSQGGSAASGPALPAGFDADAFVRQAKVHFIRLQAANDAGNLDDIREFTTPEMFAEVRLQFAERAPGEQRTDVVELNGEVLEAVEEETRYIVSVRFTGLLREEADAAPAPFDEVWHLTKAKTGDRGWVLAGIQQVA